GLLKVDCLALGMLTVIRKAMAYISKTQGKSEADRLTLARIPREDPATYAMLSTGDAVGVFQVESRAQMAMLPRLKPRCFYDLVIEVAIVRPGPIQGDMVHPYLERRADPSQVRYPSPDLETVLKRTLGVPIFQEQVMQIAIVAAGFTPGEADQLRRAMAAWKRRGGLEPFRDKLMAGMSRRGYSADFAERIFSQIKGFGDYGFPESHAASFALLTYFSAWLKCHHPAAFACGLLNSQPMGFYAPAQIVNDVKRHGVQVWPVDVRFSAWDSELALDRNGHQGVRLGLRMIKGLNEIAGEQLVQARECSAFRSVQDLVERARLDRGQVRALADGGALKGLAGHRGRARWEALAARRQGDLLADCEIREERVTIRPPDRQDTMLDDYASTGLSLNHHPAALIRPQLSRNLKRAREFAQIPNDSRIQAVGLVTHRQRPGTASGVVFLSLEDETGIINVVVWPKLLERYRKEVLESQLLRVAGTLQNANGTQHLIARHLVCEDGRLERLSSRSRDFH
ncbi:MAG: OB-fold nucleic acid binding domain-containing protein, partial [Pseudomonadota bacterium]